MSRACSRQSASRGFTLVELLVVIAIIGVLVALLLPAVQAAREAARRAQCQTNLKQVSTAILNYESTYGTLPHGSGFARSTPMGNWVTAVSPFLEQDAIFQQFNFNLPLDSPPNSTMAQTALIPTLVCPTDELSSTPILSNRRQVTAGPNNNPPISMGLWYTGSMGPTIPDVCDFVYNQYTCLGCAFGTINADGKARTPCSLFHPRSTTNIDSCAGLICRRHDGISMRRVTDGVTNTILAGETLPGHWTYNCAFCPNFPVSSTHIPMNQMESDDGLWGQASEYWRTSGFKSMHPGGINVVMGDGSVHFFEETMDIVVYNMLGSRASNDTPATKPF